jgi:hypothetical protein
LKANRKINDRNYVKALAKCSKLIKKYVRSAKKTSIIQDIKDLMSNSFKDEKDINIIKYSLSQKKVLYNHIKLFNNRLLKEFQNDIFVNMKKKYV